MQILKGGVLYFSLVFATGFVLRTIRVLWIVPSIGMRLADLMELPIVLAVTIIAARLAVRCLPLGATPGMRLVVGLVALGWLLVAELTVILWVRHLTIAGYLASLDPV